MFSIRKIVASMELVKLSAVEIPTKFYLLCHWIFVQGHW